MRILFMGTPDFAVSSLIALQNEKHDIIGVFTKEDKPQGRKGILTPSPVKKYATESGIPVYTPKTLRTDEITETVKALNPDLIAVVAYGKIIPGAILSIPKYGCVNVHGSLLPKYRGAAPIQRAVINGEKVTGITTMLLNEGLDTGDMLLSREYIIGENETFGDVWNNLSVIGAELLALTVGGLENGTITPKKQDDSLSTYAEMLTPEEEKIDINESALNIHNKIRGFSPNIGAYLINGDKKLKILLSKLTGEKQGNTGEITIRKNRLFVTCGDGYLLELIRLKEEGSREMDAASFINGRKISSEDKLI